ncbi:sequence-specific DNA binding transcription factor [Abeliophyllum distichum]|uniref:Sequence-specific DNA binding transcription factor n=1 Tax=Abeliophyllum distichum TaxID=126358 RepID=A0ABD1QAI9_9LAMI
MMELNSPSGNMMQQNGSYGGLDLQRPTRVHHHQQNPLAPHQHHSHPTQGSSIVHPTIHENFPLTIGSMQDRDQTFSLADYDRRERRKSASDEDEPSFTEETADGGSDPSRGKKASQWHRVKWTDAMVKLLITAVSYISEEAAAEYGGAARRKYASLQKKGKWKSVSKVMAERGHFVSPQQCEDKFNDLNKRYKRLNEILGRGTSCEVVENPSLLDVMDHISEKAKEEVRKILSSKHLHYEEMCSYHNGNRLHLPPDPELQRSLRLALRSRDDHDDSDVKRHSKDYNDEVDQEVELDHDESEDNHVLSGDHMAYGMPGSSTKRTKQCQNHEDFSFGNSLNFLDCNRTSNFQPVNADADANQGSPEGMKANRLQKEWINHRALQLEEQRLHIQEQMLELEKDRFKWQRFCRKKDREMDMTRMEIERMKLENERMALELRRKEMGIDNS